MASAYPSRRRCAGSKLETSRYQEYGIGGQGLATLTTLAAAKAGVDFWLSVCGQPAQTNDSTKTLFMVQ